MNILPPMMTVWYHCARKYLGNSVDITIFDCSGKLDPAEVPGARVQKFLNLYAATKCDEFLYHIAKNRRIGWICDDDVFFVGGTPLKILEREFQNPKTASVSFRPRMWWHYEMDGKRIWPSGSYCLALNREIFVEKEHLSLAPRDGNPHPADRGRPPGRYDTFDYANEQLLKKGYTCSILSEAEQKECIAGFSGISGAVMLLNYFKTSEETLDFFESPEKKQWSGNVLFGTLCAMLAICTIQECFKKLKGTTYPLPSLPSRLELEKIRRNHEQYLRSDQSFIWIEEATDALKRAL
jgi:hypothetical protein